MQRKTIILPMDTFICIMCLITARKRSLRRLCFYTCLSVILFTRGSASVHAGIHTPSPQEQTHREQTPWEQTPPLRSACWEIRSTSGRYASYLNAYLLVNRFGLKLSRQLRESRVWLYKKKWSNYIRKLLKGNPNWKWFWSKSIKYWPNNAWKSTY